jgi:hypothetical protein
MNNYRMGIARDSNKLRIIALDSRKFHGNFIQIHLHLPVILAESLLEAEL